MFTVRFVVGPLLLRFADRKEGWGKEETWGRVGQLANWFILERNRQFFLRFTGSRTSSEHRGLVRTRERAGMSFELNSERVGQSSELRVQE